MIDVLSLVKGFAAGGSGALLPVVWVYQYVVPGFVPSEEYHRHVAESNRGYVLDVVEQARNESDGPFKDSLCRALTEAISQLCADSPNDSICVDRMLYLDRAGC